MSIMKPTLGEALRRRWKLALPVFILGVLAALVSNSTDVTGVLDEMEAAVEEVSEAAEDNPEEVPTEQLGQMARGAGVLFVLTMLAMLFSVGVIVLGSFMPHGMLSHAEDGESATAPGWDHYGGIQSATLVFTALLGLTAAARIPEGGFALATSVAALGSVCLLGAIACAVSFAFAAHGNRQPAWIALGYYLGSMVVGAMVSLVDSLLDGNTLGSVFQFVLFPSAVIRDFIGGLGAQAWNWGATALVVWHFALWTLIAWLGVRRRSAQPDGTL